MPVIIPPSAFDVPAIVRSAAHSPGNPADTGRPISPPFGVARPAEASQSPQIVRPPTPTPPQVPRPAESSQGPQIVGPAPAPLPLPPATTTPNGAAAQTGRHPLK